MWACPDDAHGRSGPRGCGQQRLSGYAASMASLLRIADLDEQGIILTMPEVLSPLRPDVESLGWSILDLREAVPQEGHEADLDDVERRVSASPDGLRMSFRDLSDFAAKTRQMIDGLFVACADPAQMPKCDDHDAAILARSDVVLPPLTARSGSVADLRQSCAVSKSGSPTSARWTPPAYPSVSRIAPGRFAIRPSVRLCRLSGA